MLSATDFTYDEAEMLTAISSVADIHDNLTAAIEYADRNTEVCAPKFGDLYSAAMSKQDQVIDLLIPLIKGLRDSVDALGGCLLDTARRYAAAEDDARVSVADLFPKLPSQVPDGPDRSTPQEAPGPYLPGKAPRTYPPLVDAVGTLADPGQRTDWSCPALDTVEKNRWDTGLDIVFKNVVGLALTSVHAPDDFNAAVEPRLKGGWENLQVQTNLFVSLTSFFEALDHNFEIITDRLFVAWTGLASDQAHEYFRLTRLYFRTFSSATQNQANVMGQRNTAYDTMNDEVREAWAAFCAAAGKLVDQAKAILPYESYPGAGWFLALLLPMAAAGVDDSWMHLLGTLHRHETAFAEIDRLAVPQLQRDFA